jgi:hypothetical protein
VHELNKLKQVTKESDNHVSHERNEHTEVGSDQIGLERVELQKQEIH